jgi:predicted DNA-binding transcriptional regulator YafY
MFAPRAEARSKIALRGAFRVWRGKNVETVKVRFSPEVADEIRERRWGAGQRIEEVEGGGVILTMEVAGTKEVERWVLGFGEDAEMVEPKPLRENVRRRIRRSVERYQEESDQSRRPLAGSRSSRDSSARMRDD